MRPPNLNDVIVSVSSGWEPSPLGIIRLSGPGCFDLVEQVGPAVPTGPLPRWTSALVRVDDEAALPACLLWFRAPRSYTGQDVVELHTVGCLPLLRALCVRLMALGARRALGGEFTARALINGRMSAAQVERVLELMRARDETGLRQAARAQRDSRSECLQAIVEKLTTLLARLEAGLDFAEEEDVRFVTAAEVLGVIDAALTDLLSVGALGVDRRAARPHIALVGPPNAGKSTLFNALLGRQRAIVSPVLGTTRDVLSAELSLKGITVVLQDCAGLGGDCEELDLATHLATERAARQADLVLWLHPLDQPWDGPAIRVCSTLPPGRRLLVYSKADLPAHWAARPPPLDFAEVLEVSAASGAGLSELRERLAALVATIVTSGMPADSAAEVTAAKLALERARDALREADTGDAAGAELVSLELREAIEALGAKQSRPLDELLLDRIFSEFCVGK